MRIQYNYKNYNNSKNATNVSQILNMILAYLSLPLIAGNLFAIFGFGITLCEKLAENEGYPWEFQVLFIIVYIVDLLYLSLHFFIDALSDNVALSEKMQNKDEDEKKIVLKRKRQEKFKELWKVIKWAIIYFPSFNVVVVFISILVYGITESNLSATIISIFVLLFDVVICFAINKYSNWGHMFDVKLKSNKKKTENKKMNSTRSSYNKTETLSSINSTNSTNEKQSIEVLREYKKLLDDGIITNEEFDLKKKQLLGL